MKYEVLTHKNSFKKTWFHTFGNRSQVQHTSMYKHVDLPAETELAYFWRCIYHSASITEFMNDILIRSTQNFDLWSLLPRPKIKLRLHIFQEKHFWNCGSLPENEYFSFNKEWLDTSFPVTENISSWKH